MCCNHRFQEGWAGVLIAGGFDGRWSRHLVDTGLSCGQVQALHARQRAPVDRVPLDDRATDERHQLIVVVEPEVEMGMTLPTVGALRYRAM